MNIHLIAIGDKMPGWVDSGYQEYARRMPAACRLQLQAISARHRGKNADLRRITRDEGRQMLAAIPRGSRVVALEVQGRAWNTKQLALQLENWMSSGGDVSLLVGGPEGLAPECRKQADQLWSLSPLTLPHPLVRVIIAEQLYRAWSILANHPYHRA